MEGPAGSLPSPPCAPAAPLSDAGGSAPVPAGRAGAPLPGRCARRQRTDRRRDSQQLPHKQHGISGTSPAHAAVIRAECRGEHSEHSSALNRASGADTELWGAPGARGIRLGTWQGHGNFQARHEAYLCYSKQVFPPTGLTGGQTRLRWYLLHKIVAYLIQRFLLFKLLAPPVQNIDF